MNITSGFEKLINVIKNKSLKNQLQNTLLNVYLSGT